MTKLRDHGGGLDAAVRNHGGDRADWLDLSTGINPVPYPVGQISQDAWTALPDQGAMTRLLEAARKFWDVPDEAAIIAAPGASALIARIPSLRPKGSVHIHAPTYNEHAAAFRASGWQVGKAQSDAQVVVHPNNPDGRLWTESDLTAPFRIIDESFCDTTPKETLMRLAGRPGTLLLKSFGKFWGLAGLRLGFAIGDPGLVSELAERLGPWATSGPAIEIGARALGDPDWAMTARKRLAEDAARLDRMMVPHGQLVGGTDLFRLYDVDDAATVQNRLAQHHIWTRIFPYSTGWLRLGLPAPDRWAQLEAAL
jgi:cobalamin biosynthetic protein CobC